MAKETLLEGTGLQYVTIPDVSLKSDSDSFTDGRKYDLLKDQHTFFIPEYHNETRPSKEFTPWYIVPKPSNACESGYVDVHNNPISQSRLFSIQGADVFKALSWKWLPLPYTIRKMKGGGQHIDANNWVRLWIDYKSYYKIDLVLCVDTNTFDGPVAPQITGFPKQHLGHSVSLDPLSGFFWNSDYLKAAVYNIGQGTKSADAKDKYPAFSHFIALMKILESNELLPEIELVRSEGHPVDVHLFLDVGNSRTCGILAEQLSNDLITFTGQSFEKLRIRNVYRPTEVFDEPFDTYCSFLPSPFDPEFFSGVEWSGNFRIPSVMRVGDCARVWESFQDDGSQLLPYSSSSPKRYLWSSDLEPQSWYFGKKTLGNQDSVIKGDILGMLDENGFMLNGSSNIPPRQPCYPKSSLMTFFLIELLFHAFSQVNSSQHRRRKGSPNRLRMLRNVVLVAPNGMVPSERKLYRERVQHAVRVFWRVAEVRAPMPRVYLDYDEATCTQLVYLYSLIQHRFGGEGKFVFECLGKKRLHQNGNSGKPSKHLKLRIASLDIGGGTTDLMITDYVDQSRGGGVSLRCLPLCSEGVSVAGDEVVRNIIREIILPGLEQVASDGVPGNMRETTGLADPFGSGPPDNSAEFLFKRKQCIDQVLVPMAQSLLAFAGSESAGESCTFFWGLPDGVGDGTTQPLFPNKLPDAATTGFLAEILNEFCEDEFGGQVNHTAIQNQEWVVQKRDINRIVTSTLRSVLGVFSEVISLYECDVILLSGKLSQLSCIRDYLVYLCPLPPDRIVSLTNFEAGPWYPFDKQSNRIRDAKTTVAVGAALWFFSENLRQLLGFSMTSESRFADAAKLFIGERVGKRISNEAILFPEGIGARSWLEVHAPKMLGSRFINCELAETNPVYLVSVENSKNYSFPIKIKFRQSEEDQSQLKLREARDANKRQVRPQDIKIKLRTMDSESYWLDTGAVF